VRVTLGKKHTVYLDQPRKGKIVLDTGKRGPGGRLSTEENDINAAIAFAEEYLAAESLDSLQSARLATAVERAQDTITVGHVAALFRHTKYARVSSAKRYRLAVRVAEAVFGRSFPVRK